MPEKKTDIWNNTEMLEWWTKRREKKVRWQIIFGCFFTSANRGATTIIISWIPSKCSVTPYLYSIFFSSSFHFRPKETVWGQIDPTAKIVLFMHWLVVTTLVSMSWITLTVKVYYIFTLRSSIKTTPSENEWVPLLKLIFFQFQFIYTIITIRNVYAYKYAINFNFITKLIHRNSCITQTYLYIFMR